MDFTEVLYFYNSNDRWIRPIILIILLAMILRRVQKKILIPAIILVIFSFVFSYSLAVYGWPQFIGFEKDKERLMYESFIYKGYIYNSQPIKHDNWIFADQLVLYALYLFICFGFMTDQNATNWISLWFILVLILGISKIVTSIIIDVSRRGLCFNTIQSYVYIFCMVSSIIYYKKWGGDFISHVTFNILMVVTSIYLILSPLVNTFNDVECSYFEKEENCNNQPCIYEEGKCSSAPGSKDNTDNTGDQNNSSPPCSSYNDESGCNSGNNCYYVKENLDRSEFSSEGITKVDSKTGCISEDNKCDDYSCNSEFYPLNIFDVCCNDELYKNGCTDDEIKSNLDDKKDILDETKQDDSSIKTLYGQEAWSKKVDYDESYRYCESKNRRSEMEAGIYA